MVSSASAQETATRTEYAIDPVHSAILWKVQHKGAGYTWGRFNEFSGKVSAEGRNPESLSVDLTVQAASVDSANAKRDEHLRNADFFNAVEFPTITFKSKVARKISDTKLELTGDLTIRGVTKEITAPVELVGTATDKGTRLVGAEATFSISRSDFGITYGKGSLGERVTIIAALEGMSR
jgi:polyisoprenoid-binding protein YceI